MPAPELSDIFEPSVKHTWSPLGSLTGQPSCHSALLTRVVSKSFVKPVSGLSRSLGISKTSFSIFFLIFPWLLSKLGELIPFGTSLFAVAKSLASTTMCSAVNVNNFSIADVAVVLIAPVTHRHPCLWISPNSFLAHSTSSLGHHTIHPWHIILLMMAVYSHMMALDVSPQFLLNEFLQVQNAARAFSILSFK